MLEKYKGRVLVIKHYSINLIRRGGFIRVYVAEIKDLNDYNRGLVNDNGRVDIDQMEDITEQLIPYIGTRIDMESRIWYPGTDVDRHEVIATDIQQKTNNLFDSRVLGVYGKGNYIKE